MRHAFVSVVCNFGPTRPQDHIIQSVKCERDLNDVSLDLARMELNYVHGKQLRSCRDCQFVPEQASKRQFTSS